MSMDEIVIACPQCGKELKLRDRKLLGRKGKCPKCAHLFLLEEPPPVELDVYEPPEASGPAEPAVAVGWTSFSNPPMLEADLLPSTPELVIPGLEAVPSGLPQQDPLQRHRRRRQQSNLKFAGLLLVLGGICAGAAWQMGWMGGTVDANGAALGEAITAPDDATAAMGDAATQELAEPEQERWPLSLQFVPAGVRMVLHVRPSELFLANSPGEELVFCFGPLGQRLEDELRAMTLSDPEELEQALFCWIPGERGTLPALSVVWKYKADQRRDDLLERIGNERLAETQHAVYRRDERAYYIHDSRTMASAPLELLSEFDAAIEQPALTTTGMQAVLSQFDQSLPVAAVFEPTAARIDLDVLAIASAHPFLNRWFDWLGEEADAVGLGTTLGQTPCRVEMAWHGIAAASLNRREEQFRQQLTELPSQLLAEVQRMAPRTQGTRQLIGRLPAMLEAMALGTTMEKRGEVLQVMAALPERAAPNLVLAGLLAWDESTRTATAKPGAMAATAAGRGKTVAERLKKTIEVDFRRTPLQEAIEYIGSETGIAIEIDGEGLKRGGFTKNEPQTFAMDSAAAVEILAMFLGQPKYQPLCLVLDEKKQTLLLTTREMAKSAGQKPYELPQPKRLSQ